jgi:phage baseplate assembly protein W
MSDNTVEMPFQGRIKDLYEAVSQKYLYLNVFDEGYKLPDSMNDLIGYGSYAPMRRKVNINNEEDIARARGFAKINSDIYLSLTIPLGTRFMNPDFGSKLYSLLFEPYDDFLLDRIRMYTEDAVKKDVRKITVTNILIDTSERDYNVLKIHIEYVIINTTLSTNFVYPFVYTGPEPIRF